MREKNKKVKKRAIPSAKTVFPKEEKETKLKSAAPSTVLRFLLWGILIFLLIRGIVSIFTADSIDKQREKVEGFITQTEQEEAGKARAMSLLKNSYKNTLPMMLKMTGTTKKRCKVTLLKGLYCTHRAIKR